MKLKYLSKESHELLGQEIYNINECLVQRLLELGLVYGKSHEIFNKLKKSILYLNQVRCLLDARFFIDNPEVDAEESPYYGKKPTCDFESLQEAQALIPD